MGYLWNVEFDDEHIHRSLDILHANNQLQGRKKGREREGFAQKTRRLNLIDKIEWMNLQPINLYEGDRNPKRETLRCKWYLIIIN